LGTKEVGIYLINKKKFIECKTNDEIIEKLVENIGEEYKGINIEDNCINGYNIKLYNKISYSNDTWSNFWKCIENGENIIKEEIPANNYIAYIYKENNIFCVTTNRAYHSINKYTVSFFGVCIVSYFIRDDDKIRSASYNNIMSNFLGGSEYLGEEYQATIDKYWDRINTNLMAELDKKRFYEELGLECKRKNPKIRCDAKDNFTICSKLDINELITVIERLDIIAESELIDKFNTIEKIKDETLEEKLKEELIERMYNNYRTDKLDVCLVHKNMEKFFGSISYFFMYKDNYKHECFTIPNNKDLKEVFDDLEINSVKKMKDVISGLQLICLNSDGYIELSDNMDAFINIAIEYEDKEYLFQNKMWYKLTDNYITNLDKVFKFIKNGFTEQNIKFKPWKNKTEAEYIDLYKDTENFYKIHPKTENGIEVCDLMYIDRANEEIKMLYLKDGFGANTRDLSIQVVMGTKRILSIIKDNMQLKKFYERYINVKNTQYTFNEFKKEIKSFGKNAIMVYKLSKGVTENSNIGKQSVIFAKNEVEMLGTCKFTMKQL